MWLLCEMEKSPSTHVQKAKGRLHFYAMHVSISDAQSAIIIIISIPYAIHYLTRAGSLALGPCVT